jgi:hypothetical protein
MPKGIGYLIGALVVLVAGLGGYLWYESPKKVASTTTGKAEVRSLRVDQGGRGGTGASLKRNLASIPWFKRAPEDRYEKGEVLVVDPPKNFINGAKRLGFKVIETARLSGLGLDVYRMKAPTGTSVAEARRALAAEFPGLTVDANHHFDTQGLKDHAKQTARARIGWNKATATCGSGVRMGMIDTPVDVTHPALEGQDVEYKSFHRKGRKPGKADHGTAVAAMLVGKPDWGGLLPGGSLKAVNMFEVNETGRTVGSAMALLKGMNWLTTQKVHVINLSMAGTNNKVVRRAFNIATKKRLVMVAAAGNWGTKARPAYPAAYKEVVAVTAFGKKRAIYTRANRGGYIDFAAPGVNIYTAVPGGGRLQTGTSFATPYLAALVGSLVKSGSKQDANKLRKLLSGQARDLGDPGKDTVYGYGFVELQPKCAK